MEAICTHWKQVALWLAPENKRQLIAGSTIFGQISYKRSANNRRGYIISVLWNIRSSGEALEVNCTGYMYRQSFLLV